MIHVTKPYRLGLALVVWGVLAASPAVAHAGGGPGIEVGGYIFHASFDNESNIENDEGLGARLGILFEPSQELEFSVDHVSTEDDLGFGLDVDLTTFKAGYVYNFMPGGAVSPLFTVGGGLQHLEVSDQGAFGSGTLTDETDPLAFAGFGVRFFIGPVFNIRLDAAAQAVLPDGDPDDTLVDGIFTAGVGWMIGGH